MHLQVFVCEIHLIGHHLAYKYLHVALAQSPYPKTVFFYIFEPFFSKRKQLKRTFYKRQHHETCKWIWFLICHVVCGLVSLYSLCGRVSCFEQC